MEKIIDKFPNINEPIFIYNSERLESMEESLRLESMEESFLKEANDLIGLL